MCAAAGLFTGLAWNPPRFCLPADEDVMRLDTPFSNDLTPTGFQTLTTCTYNPFAQEASRLDAAPFEAFSLAAPSPGGISTSSASVSLPEVHVAEAPVEEAPAVASCVPDMDCDEEDHLCLAIPDVAVPPVTLAATLTADAAAGPPSAAPFFNAMIFRTDAVLETVALSRKQQQRSICTLLGCLQRELTFVDIGFNKSGATFFRLWMHENASDTNAALTEAVAAVFHERYRGDYVTALLELGFAGNVVITAAAYKCNMHQTRLCTFAAASADEWVALARAATSNV